MRKNERAVALGFFDGVHLAHRKVLSCAKRYADSHGLIPAAVTFDRPPRAEKGGLIRTVRDRVSLMEESGIREVRVLPFDETLRQTEPEDFLRQYVFGELSAAYCVAGFDYRFGREGRGNAALLMALCREAGVVCEIVSPMEDGAGKLSSTRIRELIACSAMEEVQEQLGLPYFFSGEVIHGKALGRTLGFPTMNVPIPEELVLPRAGVYACHLLLDGVEYRGVCNVAHGERPLCEVYVFDYAGDAYGKAVRVSLLHFLRAMRPFPSWEALREQVDFDKKMARDWFISR